MKRFIFTVLGGFLAIQTALSATVAAASPVVVNEFMANPVVVVDSSTEWVELFNAGDATVVISSWKVNGFGISTDGDVPATIDTKSFFTICFEQAGVPINDVACDAYTTAPALADAGMALTITDENDDLVQTFTYPAAPAGQSTIVKYNEDGTVAQYQHDMQNVYAAEDETTYNTGTPGVANTILQQIETTADFSTFAAAIHTAGLEDLLDDPTKALSVFAPTNAAFAALPAAELTALLNNPAQLRYVLSGHIADNYYSYEDLSAMSSVTLESGVAPITTQGDDLLVGGAVVSDIVLTVSNGQLYSIPAVLLPKSNDVTVNPITASTTSPALSGTVASGYSHVLVRVNGASHIATVTGTTWTIPAGVVMLNTTGSQIISVIGCTDELCSEGLVMSMSTTAVTYAAPVTIVKAAVVTHKETVAAAKGGSTGDSSTGSTSSSTATNTDVKTDTPVVAEATDTPKDESADETESSNAPWYWWAIGVGVLAGLWYVLGRQPNTTGKK